MFARFARFAGLGGIPTTLGDPLYRALFLVLVAQGVIFGGQTPFTPLWAKEVLGADTVGAGVLQAWAALLAVCFGLAYGLRSDRTRRRTRWLLVAFLLGIPARLALPWVTEYWVGVALNAVATMGTFSLVFALLGDWLRYRQEQQSAQIHSTIRLAFALGWQIGAAGAGIVVARLGYGGLFLLTAALQAVTVFCVIWGVRDAPATDDSPATNRPPTTDRPPATHDQQNQTEKPATPAGGPQTDPHHTRTSPRGVGRPANSPTGWRVHHALLLYLLCIWCVGAASTARMTLLPLYLTEQLHATPGVVGSVFAIEAVYELPLFLLVGRLADRHGAGTLLPVGLLAGVCYYAGLGLSHSVLPVFFIEALFALLIAAVNNLGILYVQDLLPRHGGTALAFYNAASRLGPLAAAPALGYLVERSGWGSAFFTASGLVLLGTAAFFFSRRARTNSPLTPLPVEDPIVR